MRSLGTFLLVSVCIPPFLAVDVIGLYSSCVWVEPRLGNQYSEEGFRGTVLFFMANPFGITLIRPRTLPSNIHQSSYRSMLHGLRYRERSKVKRIKINLGSNLSPLNKRNEFEKDEVSAACRTVLVGRRKGERQSVTFIRR
jgi:hypothetical protein